MMSSNSPKDNKKLLVILIDGFRWDYFDTFDMEFPGFKELFSGGVKAEYLVPDFPTLSFPNFHTLMTGLHVEDHAFVGNFMYHEERNNSFEFKMKTQQSNHSHWFEGGEPLWITAVKQGKRSYMFEWPGCHVKNNGVHPTFHDVMENWPGIPQMEKNLQRAIQLLNEDKIDMAGVYLNYVDLYGHSYGPNSEQVKAIVQQTDNVIKDMMQMLKSVKHKINVVIFSDHGMTEISESRTIDISDHVGPENVREVKDKGAVCSIWPKEGKMEKVYLGLNQINNKHMAVYKKKDLLERWHYRNHKLVAPITVVADLGWYILTPEYQGIDVYLDGPCRGHHGYDNAEPDMRGIFLALGPDFKENFKTGPLQAVDVYQVMCKALDIQPLPHKGTWDNVKDIFK